VEPVVSLLLLSPISGVHASKGCSFYFKDLMEY
jgi:hypothetical protein